MDTQGCGPSYTGLHGAAWARHQQPSRHGHAVAISSAVRSSGAIRPWSLAAMPMPPSHLSRSSSEHTVYAPCAHTVHTPCVHRAHTVHTLCTHRAHSMHVHLSKSSSRCGPPRLSWEALRSALHSQPTSPGSHERCSGSTASSACAAACSPASSCSPSPASASVSAQPAGRSTQLARVS